MTIKIVKINPTFNVSKDNALKPLYKWNLPLSSGVSNTGTLRKLYSSRKFPNFYSKGIPLLCNNFTLIHNNKYIGKRLYSTDFWTLESNRLMSYNNKAGFDDVIVMKFVKNKNFAGIKDFNNNKYCKEYNKVLEKSTSTLTRLHEKGRFVDLPKFLKDYGFFTSKFWTQEFALLHDLLLKALVLFGLTKSS